MAILVRIFFSSSCMVEYRCSYHVDSHETHYVVRSRLCIPNTVPNDHFQFPEIDKIREMPPGWAKNSLFVALKSVFLVIFMTSSAFRPKFIGLC